MRIRIPGQLRQWSNGQEVIELRLPADARITVAEVFARLASEYPGIRQRVLDDQGNLRHHVNVFVNGENVRFAQGLATVVDAASEVAILPAISGGVASVRRSRGGRRYCPRAGR
jgi:sulfur-carrier protein